MKEVSVSKFDITSSQYELFRFNVERPMTLNIQLIATAPVNLLVLDNEQRAEYENGKSATHTYKAAWGRRSDLDEAIKVSPGTWYVVVEGSTEPSRGHIILGPDS